MFTRAERLFGRKSFSIVLGGGFFLFVPFLFFSSLSPKCSKYKTTVKKSICVSFEINAKNLITVILFLKILDL